MKTAKRLLSVLLALALVFGGTASIAANAVGPAEYYPAIVIPGVFQSEVKYLNDDGTEKLKDDGTPYSAPFFMEDTKEIVKDALFSAIVPVANMLLTQEDKEAKAAQAIADVLGRALAGNIKCDANGEFIKNIRATRYDTNLAELSAYDRAYALSAIPLDEYASKVGTEHMYFFSYESLGNIKEIANRLYDLIQTAKEQHNGKKVNLAPVSQGGSIFNALMQIYIDKGRKLSDDVNRVCLLVPAADGTAILGDIYRYGLIDDNDALYEYMIPSLLGRDMQWVANAVTLALRLIPNADVNNILDTAVHTLIEDYLEYSTCLWALLPSGDYEACRKMYLMDEDDAVIREQTDWYYNAQLNSRKNILDAKNDGVAFFDIVDYNYPLFKICDSWSKVNADGVIHVDSTSLGAVTANNNESLPDGYVQANTYCTDPTHNHIDEARIIDASAGILCDTTFYFKGQPHVDTARNDVIIRLASRILWDESFKDVYSDPAFPQFNYGRDSSTMRYLYYRAWYLDTAELDENVKTEYDEALAAAKDALASTVMKTEDFNAVYARLKAVVDLINGVDNTPTKKENILSFIARLLKWFNQILVTLFKGKAFSEMFPLRFD